MVILLDAVEQGLCFGRLDMHDGRRVYVGRLSLFRDEDGEPLLVDWRAPVARAFYTATATASQGVRRRRRITTRGRTVVALNDELLDPDGAGAAPVTRASGRSLSITHRRVKNDRLAAAGFVWAFVAATHSPGASVLYYRRREHGDRHAAALRNVFNRLIGCLYHCLHTGQAYDETTAFPAQAAAPEPTAA